MRDVILADNAGFCFGVQRAVEETLKIQNKFNTRVYTLGPLIHNNDVVNYLKENNIYSIDLSELDSLPPETIIVVRSHGVSKEIMDTLLEKKFNVLDATCPFVTNIHKKVNKYSEEGYQIIILGDKDHPEVQGIDGWCKEKAIITKDGIISESLNEKICIVSQTTEKEENWNKTIKNISKTSQDILSFNTICAATEERQKSVIKVSKQVDFMIVVGGKNSSNTTKLYELAKENCKNAIHIENAKELSNLQININVRKVGITAGASTPDWIIKEVIDVMKGDIKMEDQAQLMDQMDVVLNTESEVEVEVAKINNDTITVLLNGYGKDGVIPFKELTYAEDLENTLNTISVGDTIKAKVIQFNNNDGYVVLSRLELIKEESLNKLEEVFNNNETLTLTVKNAVDKGLVATFNGIRVFIPASQIDVKFIRNTAEFVGKDLDVKIINFSRKNPTKVVASSRVIIETELNAKEGAAWGSLNLNDVVKAEVKRFTTFGAFAEVNGIDGLIHLSQISWNHIKKAEDVLEVGQIIDVKIIGLDKESKKLSLSIKELTPEPWSDVEEKYPVGATVSGKVVRISGFGAFVELEPGLDGLVHLSQISWKHVKSAEDALEIGQTVDVKVIGLDKENKKLSLSIKELTAEPWSNAEQKYPVGSAVLGTVVRISDFGAFVELEPGLDGLVHISKISHAHIKHPSEALAVNDEVKCIILEVNKDEKKLALSIRDAE